MTTNKGYATTKQLANIIGIKVDVPSSDVGKNLINEQVGQGNNSKVTFNLKHRNILDTTYSLLHGIDKDASDELIETTDYSMDLDTGTITLTDTGKTTLGTDIIFAKYSYIKNGMKDSYLSSIINRAESRVDNETNTTFTDSTVSNPTYPQETEIQSSTGYFRDQIISEEKPLIDVVSFLDGAIDDSQNTIDLASGTGLKFPLSGNIIIDSEVISYTGIITDQLTGVIRGILGTDAAEHLDEADVHSTILFLSNTQQGTKRVYTVQPWDSSMHASDTGLFYSFNSYSSSGVYSSGKMATQDVSDRVKLIYYYGYDTIPYDIERLTLILAKEMLLKDNVGSSLISGRDGFSASMVDSDRMESESIINSYIVVPMGNT